MCTGYYEHKKTGQRILAGFFITVCLLFHTAFNSSYGIHVFVQCW